VASWIDGLPYRVIAKLCTIRISHSERASSGSNYHRSGTHPAESRIFAFFRRIISDNNGAHHATIPQSDHSDSEDAEKVVSFFFSKNLPLRRTPSRRCVMKNVERRIDRLITGLGVLRMQAIRTSRSGQYRVKQLLRRGHCPHPERLPKESKIGPKNVKNLSDC